MATRARAKPTREAPDRGMVVSDLYLKTTAPDGSVSITQHRVWDGERFFTAAVDDAKKAGRGTVELSSAVEYKEHRK